MFHDWEMEGFEWPANEPSADAEPVEQEAKEAVDPLTAAKRRRTAAMGGIAPPCSEGNASAQGGVGPLGAKAAPLPFDRWPQNTAIAIGGVDPTNAAESNMPQTSGLAAVATQGGVVPTCDSYPGEVRGGSEAGRGECDTGSPTMSSTLADEASNTIPCCPQCGHLPGTTQCCMFGADRRKKTCPEAKRARVRYNEKAKGCTECEGPCAQQPVAAIPQEDPMDDELAELNQPLGNWRLRKRQNDLLREAALRTRLIPSSQDAVTPAAKKMAALRDKVRANRGDA